MAIEFNGSIGDIIDGNNAVLRPTAGLTYMAWINADSAGEASGGRIIDLQYQELTMSTSNRINFVCYNGAFQTISSNISSITFGQDHMVVGTWDGTTQKTYVDAVQQSATNTFTGPLTYPVVYNLYIGNSPVATGARTFDGRIWDVRIYNRALTQDEITTLYNSRGSDTIINGMALRMPIDEFTDGHSTVGADRVVDLSGNNNTGVPSLGLIYRAKPTKLNNGVIYE
jgi:hypothetical protein